MVERIEFIKALTASLTGMLYNQYLLFNQRVEEFIKGGDEELGNS